MNFFLRRGFWRRPRVALLIDGDQAKPSSLPQIIRFFEQEKYQVPVRRAYFGSAVTRDGRKWREEIFSDQQSSLLVEAVIPKKYTVKSKKGFPELVDKQVFELLASHDCPEAFAVTRPEMRTFFESHGANFVNDRFPFDHDGEIGKLQTQAARLRELNKQIRAEQSLFGTRRMPLPLAAVARPRRGEDGGETGVSVAVDWTRTYRKSRGFRVDGRKSDYYYRRGAEERGGTLSTRSGSAGHHRQLLRDGGDRKLRDDGDAGVLARGVSHDVAEPQKKFAVDRGMVRPGVLLTSLQQVVEDAVDTKDQVGEPEPPKKRKNPKKKRNFPKRPKKKTAGAQGEMFRKSSKVPSSRRTRKTTGKNRKKARFRVSVQKAWEALLQESVAGNNQRPGLRV